MSNASQRRREEEEILDRLYKTAMGYNSTASKDTEVAAAKVYLEHVRKQGVK